MKHLKLVAIVLLFVFLSCERDNNSESKNLIVFESANYSSINAICIDAEDNLWIVQEGSTLSSYNLEGIIKSYYSPVGEIFTNATKTTDHT